MYSPIWASTMLPVQRHQKPKGFKVKHVVQITMITVVLTWVIYQLNHSQRTAHISYDDDEVGGLQDSRTGVMIGWKGLKPNLQATEQEQEREQEVDRDELADEERDEVNAFDAAEGTAEESVRDDVGFVEDTAKTGGDLQDEEQVQDVEVVETDEQDNDQFDGSDLDQQREDADLQQHVGIDFTDLKNEEGRSNWDKSAQDSGNEDLEFNEGLRGGATTEQPAEKTETKATDSAMNLSTVVDGDEKVKENEVSHVEEVGKNTILRTKDSESMVNNKWEDSTMTSKPEQGSSQELGKQPETETMNLESEGTQVQEKLGQDSDKINDETSKDVIVSGESHSQETSEVRKGDDSSQEQGNHEPKKETETENVGDGSQGRKEEYQMNDWHKEGTEESNKEIESQQQAEALNSENVQSSSEEEDKADEFTRQRMEIEKSIQGFSKVKDEIHNIDTDSQQGSRDGGAQESQETKEKVVVDQGLEGVLWDHRSYEEKGENRSEEQKGEEKGDRASQENQSSITADDKSGAVGKDSHETGPKHSYTDNGQGRDGSDWTNTSTQNTEVQEIQDSTAMWQVVSQVGDSQNNQESGRDAELMKPEGQLTNEDENNAADTQQQSGHSWIDPTIQEVADKREENKE